MSAIKAPKVTAERVREVVSYDPDTGVFRWKVKISRGVVAGRIAGGLAGVGGYWRIRIDKTTFLAHRLAWLYMTGSMCPLIDHINGEKADNRWVNLREGTTQTNAQNQRRAMSTNRLGVLGVDFSQGKYRAYITCNRKVQFLGQFDTAEQAHQTYLQAKRRLHVGCTI